MAGAIEAMAGFLFNYYFRIFVYTKSIDNKLKNIVCILIIYAVNDNFIILYRKILLIFFYEYCMKKSIISSMLSFRYVKFGKTINDVTNETIIIYCNNIDSNRLFC